jgi:hypothetical protein
MARNDDINQLPTSNFTDIAEFWPTKGFFDQEYDPLGFFDLDFGSLVKKVGHPSFTAYTIVSTKYSHVVCYHKYTRLIT